MHNIEEEMMTDPVVETPPVQLRGTVSHDVGFKVDYEVDDSVEVPSTRINSEWKIFGTIPNGTDVTQLVYQSLVTFLKRIQDAYEKLNPSDALDINTDPQKFFDRFYHDMDFCDVVAEDVTVRFFAPVASRITMPSDTFEIYTDNVIQRIRDEFTAKADAIIEQIKAA